MVFIHKYRKSDLEILSIISHIILRSQRKTDELKVHGISLLRINLKINYLKINNHLYFQVVCYSCVDIIPITIP